ncbi:MAG: hypothetical protein V4640_05825 [Verrucomicrobiota bacterium]
MKYDILELAESHHSNLDDVTGAPRVRVVLLDHDNLAMAHGSAVLPLSLGVGLFWPDNALPAFARLTSAKCFALPGGELLHLKSISLREGLPPRYEFCIVSAMAGHASAV